MITRVDVINFKGLSTDIKPATAQNGCYFYEIDTGEIYMYDAENQQWVKQ